MPPPSLSTTTTARSIPRPGAPSRPLLSWRKAMSPISSAVGPADPAATPGGRHHPVDAVGAPVGHHDQPGAGAACRSTSRIGIDDDTTSRAPSGRAATARARRARWGRPVRRPRRPAPSRPRPRPPATVQPARFGPGGRQVRRKAPASPSTTTAAVPAGSDHPGAPATTSVAARGGQPLVHDPRRAGRPQPQHPVGTEPVGGLGRAEDGVEVRHGGARRPPGRRPGLGHHGPAPGGGHGVHQVAVQARHGPGDDDVRDGNPFRRPLMVQIAAEGRRVAQGPFRPAGSSPGSRPAAPGTGG